MNKRCLAAAFAVLFFAVLPSSAADLPQAAVIGGRVELVAPAGTVVSEGDILAAVDTLAGIMPAVRASAAGIVAETCVAPGENVKRGDVLVVIEETETQEDIP